MNKHYFYLISYLVILIPVLAFLLYKGHRKLSKHWHVPLYLGLVGLIFASSEGVAFNWGVWSDNPSYVLPFRLLNAQIETYLLNFLVFAAIASSTVIMMGRRQRLKKRA
jgi:hypothetical protein